MVRQADRPVLQSFVFQEEFFRTLAPVRRVEEDVSSALVRLTLVCGRVSGSSRDPNLLVLMVAPVPVEPESVKSLVQVTIKTVQITYNS